MRPMWTYNAVVHETLRNIARDGESVTDAEDVIKYVIAKKKHVPVL